MLSIALAVALAYLLAGIPVAAAALAGAMSPMYRLERGRLACYWGWGAVSLVALLILQHILGI